MKQSMKHVMLIVSAGALLAACGEEPQVSGSRKADIAAFQGSSTAAYTVPGWKVGDATSWEAQMKSRAQGQDERTRASP